MKIFLTGATGFVGSAIVSELVANGHRVAGLARSDAGAAALTAAGADAIRGDLADLSLLRARAIAADAVIHAAFDHDSARAAQSSAHDREVIATLGDADRPLLVTSGTGLVRPRAGELARETDPHASSAEFPRAATEEAADALIARGAHTSVVRLPQVHDTRKFGRISVHIALAQQHGRVAYIGDGANRVPAAHVTDVARLYRLALERGEAGARYHAVAEEGVPLREIAHAIAARLNVPIVAIPAADRDAIAAYFGALAPLVPLDLAASGAATRERLGWTPSGPGILADLRSA